MLNDYWFPWRTSILWREIFMHLKRGKQISLHACYAGLEKKNLPALCFEDKQGQSVGYPIPPFAYQM
jgi:hypothetical protein